MKDSSIYIPACDWDSTASLPQSWGAPPLGWKYAKHLVLVNDTAHDRRGEPVEAGVDIHAGHVTDLGREIRVARLLGETDPIEVVPNQAHLMDREDELLRCRLFFLADVPAGGSATYLLLYGNPEGPEPYYDTDLKVSGEGYALEVENEHYRAVLDNVMDALRATNEFELYVQGSPWGQRQLSFVDIGIVQEVVIEGRDIRVGVRAAKLGSTGFPTALRNSSAPACGTSERSRYASSASRNGPRSD